MHSEEGRVLGRGKKAGRREKYSRIVKESGGGIAGGSVFSHRSSVVGKRGQVGETVTWVIATIIIVVVLMFFVFGATALGATKSIGIFKLSLFSGEVGVGDDQFLKKSLFTYVKAEDSSVKKLIDRSLNESYVDYGFGLSYEDTKNEMVGRYESGKD